MNTVDIERSAVALGMAVIGAWGDRPRGIQQLLSERAVVAGHHAVPRLGIRWNMGHEHPVKSLRRNFDGRSLLFPPMSGKTRSEAKSYLLPMLGMAG